ncbi:30S ribosomal protein THX [Pseudoxanthomonas composti]|uniref:30S ribosomal protein THX n=1 Tax=Pseudoxanthomonas composti TaxID=2137479 RepID=A0A4Q1JVH5_9GAMM|nr:30S ribosomal protein THX [Pseudoxanthomonas composti]
MRHPYHATRRHASGTPGAVVGFAPFAHPRPTWAGWSCAATSTQEYPNMGKGDRKTAKGKRYNASYGNARLKTTSAAVAAPVTKKTVVKSAAKKAVAKKVAKAG